MKTDFILREAAGEHWLVNIAQSGEHYEKPRRLNRSASEIMSYYLEGKNISEIAEILSGKYEVDREEAETDIRNLLRQLGV